MGKTTPQPVYLLALESSGTTCGVGLCAGTEFLGAITLEVRQVHSRLLAPFCQRLLKDAGLEPGQLGGIVVSQGPGSFTGLRIGFSLAKGLAHALHIPLVGVPTPEVWAYQLGEAYNPVLSVVDAHRGELFFGIYRWQEGELVLEGELSRLPVAEVINRVQAPAWVTGPASHVLARHEQARGNLHLRFPAVQPPSFQMWALLARGWSRFQNKQFLDLESSEPLYMRTFKGVS
ncbi:MAG: tRNA (adenosine(37)-N6)-threonylcarbamoyltransferase complex dimerization subunit type 1 TsaB [Calditrichaeota bacterium]|nr:MAG: tRNA (adenosine(37)-N6)-threonylcarbamoyltransferase complex dimerization subunit type 1 TsaB [Calditrichota bacterium]